MGRPSGTTKRRSRAEIETLLLELLAAADRPLSAYALADRATAAGHRTVPNQVYRTLERLTREGRVHRLESMSAFILRRGQADVSLICDDCHAVQTLAATELVARLLRCARYTGFEGQKAVVELYGRCADCSTSYRVA